MWGVPEKGKVRSQADRFELVFLSLLSLPWIPEERPLPAQEEGGPPCLCLRALLTASSLGPQGEAQGIPGSQVENAATGSLGNSPSVALLMPRPLSGSQSTFSKEMKSIKYQEETTLWLCVS